MTFLEECRRDAAEVWQAYAHHPWIEAMAAGTLTTKQFVFFQLDDGAHVAEFNRALALGVAKAPTGHAWARAAAHVLDDMSTTAELAEKQSLLDELGAGQPMRHDRWSCSPEREGYVNHLVRVAYEGTFAHIAASLYPCSLFTTVVGERFRGVTITGPPAFRRWADMYTRRTRNEMCARHAEVIEQAAETGGDAERCTLRRLYRRSLEHQVRVFDAAWRGERGWPGSTAPCWT
ncbi:TenA family protein [Salinispora sp. H7-4]|uniref:TenA family protein n=1 Tax=Salinispora sp. H7-4 TaxID=2748321 RepID=UPI0015D2A7C8|nr:hypothetical protein [Salinispora sp. H7-4]NYT92298.1 hypothetical protein [Salinispora sp. H7-4]